MNGSKHRVLAVVGLVAAVAAFWYRGDCPCSEASPVATREIATSGMLAVPELPSVHQLTWPSSSRQSRRNIFGFPEGMRKEPVISLVAVSPEPAAPEWEPTPAIDQTSKPAFSYVWLGTFGPREAPVVVFRKDEELLIRRVGEVIGDGFVLKRIGIETLVVTAPGSGDQIVTVGRRAI